MKKTDKKPMHVSRPMSAEKKAEYDRLTENAYQLQLQLEELENEPQVYGYARVSTQGQARDGTSLEDQTRKLKAAGAVEVFADAFTGTLRDRPQLDALLANLRPGDTIVVTKLDRMARSTLQGLELIQELTERDVTVNILDFGGPISKKPADQLRLTMLLAFAQYERDMIIERTREGKERARLRADYREGRLKKFDGAQIKHALELLQIHSYTEVRKMTGISKSTLIRAKRGQI